MANNQSFFVYIDFTDDGRPFYVGKGKAQRVQQRTRNTVWKRIAVKDDHRRNLSIAAAKAWAEKKQGAK